MSDVKQLALEVFEGRKESIKEREKRNNPNKTIEDYVEDIIKIFKLSNSSKHSTLIWQIILSSNDLLYSKEGYSCTMFSFQEYPTADIYDLSKKYIDIDLPKFEVFELWNMINNLRVPHKLVEGVCDYFAENLSEYFEVTEGESYFNYRRIILKSGEMI